MVVHPRPQVTGPLRPDLHGVRSSEAVMAVRFSPELDADAVAACSPAPTSQDGGTLTLGRDRFAKAWARGPNEAFEGYEQLWPSFWRDLEAVRGRIVASGRPEPVLVECELRYTNPINAEETWHRHGQLERLLLRWLGQEMAGGFLPGPDDVVANATFTLPGARHKGSGTLTISLQSVNGEGPGPLMGMTLSAVGKVQGDLAGARAFFDSAFEWIVRGFASLAPPMPEEVRPRSGLIRRARR